MIIRIKTDMLNCKNINGSSYDLKLLKSQAKELISLLTLAVNDNNTTMEKYRTKFFNEEGYMASDATIKEKYGIL